MAGTKRTWVGQLNWPAHPLPISIIVSGQAPKAILSATWYPISWNPLLLYRSFGSLPHPSCLWVYNIPLSKSHPTWSVNLILQIHKIRTAKSLAQSRFGGYQVSGSLKKKNSILKGIPMSLYHWVFLSIMDFSNLVLSCIFYCIYRLDKCKYTGAFHISLW